MGSGRSLHAPSTGRTQHLVAAEPREEREWKKRGTGQSAEAQAESHRGQNWHFSEQAADRRCWGGKKGVGGVSQSGLKRRKDKKLISKDDTASRLKICRQAFYANTFKTWRLPLEALVVFFVTRFEQVEFARISQSQKMRDLLVSQHRDLLSAAYSQVTAAFIMPKRKRMLYLLSYFSAIFYMRVVPDPPCCEVFFFLKKKSNCYFQTVKRLPLSHL